MEIRTIKHISIKVIVVLFLTFAQYAFCFENTIYLNERNESDSERIHGYLDITFKNNYITPRGLLVTNTGLTVQILGGISLNVYESKTGPTQETSIILGVWNDLDTDQNASYVGAWNELDWFVGVEFKLCKRWKFSVQFLQFLSPPHYFSAESNIEFFLGYDDSKWGLPFTLNPYLRWFWAVSGDSTVVTGKPGKTFDIELGILPIYELKTCRIPIIFTFPTWITVGPSEFWNGGELGLKKVDWNFGVFSTGINAKIPFNRVKAKLGKWYAAIGLQYYYLINENLLRAQEFTLGADSLRQSHRNICVASGGIGFTY